MGGMLKGMTGRCRGTTWGALPRHMGGPVEHTHRGGLIVVHINFLLIRHVRKACANHVSVGGRKGGEEVQCTLIFMRIPCTNRELHITGGNPMVHQSSNIMATSHQDATCMHGRPVKALHYDD